MNNQLLDTYASERQLNKYVAPQIVLNGYLKPDDLTLLLLHLEESVLSLAQSIETRNFQVWENWIDIQ